MKKQIVVSVSVLLCLLILVGGFSLIRVGASPWTAAGGAPTVVSYQGIINDGGSPFTGTGYFKFALVNDAGDTSYWSNDGSSSGGGEPAGGISLPVVDGQFQVLLGDTGLANMTSLPASAFSGTDRYLRIWFSPDDISYTLLSPDQRIAAVPYALQAEEAQYAADADTVDGFQAFELQTHYQNVIIVAKSGGHFTSIQAAVDSITDASETNPYLIWIAPGVYEESVTLKYHVHLQGAGQGVALITSDVSDDGVDDPRLATVVLANWCSLRDLSVENTGSGTENIGVLDWAGIGTLIENVNIKASGVGSENYAIYFNSYGAHTLNLVTARAENGTTSNTGLYGFDGPVVDAHNSSFTASGGNTAYGIYADWTGLDLFNTTVVGRDAIENYGLFSTNDSEIYLQGGSYEAFGGDYATGIDHGGQTTYLPVLVAVDVQARAGNPWGEWALIENVGLRNHSGGNATLQGGSFAADGGDDAFGLVNEGSGSSLTASDITAYANNATGTNTGFLNSDYAHAELSGGQYQGWNGQKAYGIRNKTSTYLNAFGVHAKGNGGSSSSYGLENHTADDTFIYGGRFTGDNSVETVGIRSTATYLEIKNAALHGESVALDVQSGLVKVAVAQVDGGASNVSGTLDCFQVYGYDYNPYTCP